MKCCDYNSGMLRKTIAFEREATTPDGAGGRTRTWANIAGAPAKGAPRAVRGQERYISERLESVGGVVVVTRYTAAVKPGDVLVMDTVRYNVEWVENVEFRNKWSAIYASFGVAT